MGIKKIFENKEGIEPKNSEILKERELSNPEYEKILQEQLTLAKVTPLESLREQNNQIIQKFKERELPNSEYKNILREPFMKSTPLESLREQNNQIIQEVKENKRGLTEDEKKEIKEAHPDWPDKIIDAIGSWEEYEIYDRAGLKYSEINGKPCLIRSDIDMNQKDEFGRTNKERMEQGLAPLDKNGKPIELHHIGQKPDSPLAELTQEEHRGRGNDTILHDKTKPSEIDRGEFQKEKEDHWETRAGQT
jgi:hypothetical protein